MGEREFADVLRAAIQARGLGLERIRERLLAHGVSVSMATLSYWQSGRSQPERRPHQSDQTGRKDRLRGRLPTRCQPRGYHTAPGHQRSGERQRRYRTTFLAVHQYSGPWLASTVSSATRTRSVSSSVQPSGGATATQPSSTELP